jgi:hypothetical protein
MIGVTTLADADRYVKGIAPQLTAYAVAGGSR